MRLADRLSRAVPSLSATALRVALVRHELAVADAAIAAEALDELCGRAEQADARAREVMAAVVPALADPEMAARVRELRGIAATRALLPLGRMLRAASPSSGAGAGPEPDAPPAAASAGRPLTLGERKALARRPSRAAFERLLSDRHPMVIHTLLQNPRLTEEDVVRLAARRPAYPEVIAEIARSPRWSQSVRVRMAVVQNPGSPAEVSVPMVSLLIRPELQQVMHAADVPPIVRAAARDLLRRRPPVAMPHGRSTRLQ